MINYLADGLRIFIGYYFFCDQFEGALKIDGVEVSECAWIPVAEALKDGAQFFGKPVYAIYQRLLKGELRKEVNGGSLNKTTRAYQYFFEFPLESLN